MINITSPKFTIFSLIFAVAFPVSASLAQSTMSPATDWTGNYNFSSPSDRNLRLLQADMIEKREKGYYESLGSTTLNQTITNNTTNNTKIGQNTNAIGSMNTTNTTIDLHGNNNSIGIDSNSTSTGCQDGSVNIGKSGSTSVTAGCR